MLRVVKTNCICKLNRDTYYIFFYYIYPIFTFSRQQNIIQQLPKHCSATINFRSPFSLSYLSRFSLRISNKNSGSSRHHNATRSCILLRIENAEGFRFTRELRRSLTRFPEENDDAAQGKRKRVHAGVYEVETRIPGQRAESFSISFACRRCTLFPVEMHFSPARAEGTRLAVPFEHRLNFSLASSCLQRSTFLYFFHTSS